MSRRRFVALAAAGLTTLAVSCRTGDDARDGDDDVTFAAPWADLTSDDMDAFGQRAAEVDPGCIAHARSTLAPGGDEAPVDPAARLDGACDADVRSGHVVDVDGWLVPRTLAGLAAALAA